MPALPLYKLQGKVRGQGGLWFLRRNAVPAQQDKKLVRIAPRTLPPPLWAQKKPQISLKICGLKKKIRQRPTLPQASPAVPSAMGLFTSVFGMETGVTSPLKPPEKSVSSFFAGKK